jgi:hypothetical protein
MDGARHRVASLEVPVVDATGAGDAFAAGLIAARLAGADAKAALAQAAVCGSLAVPLLRPHPANRTYHSETVNVSLASLALSLSSISEAPSITRLPPKGRAWPWSLRASSTASSGQVVAVAVVARNGKMRWRIMAAF